jgi:hypothetical protein
MTRDFTLEKYDALCRAVAASGRPCLPIVEYLETPAERRPPRFVLLRHDVEVDPPHAVHMAEIEARHSLRATYLFRTPGVFRHLALLPRLRELGHDVGYHYETLARTRGDVAGALERFAEDLRRLREHVPVQVASMHGSPLSRWDNRAIWERARPADFGLAGEVYRDIDYAEVAYYSDTGRTWHPTRHNLRDHVGHVPPDVVDTTDGLIALVASARAPRLCLLAHPDRWSASGPAWALRAVRDGVENAIKDVVRWSRRPRPRALA